MADTKQRILDAAEALLAEQGFGATSLRQIIAHAGVNLASVHYHFGSKDELLDEVIVRKAGPVNAARLALLEEFERQAAGNPLPVEQILTAFLDPPFREREKSPRFVRLMGRMYGEGLMPLIVAKHFHPIVARFQSALRLALPQLAEDELRWRIHFMIGAMAYSMFGPPDAANTHNSKEVARRLVAFLSAGLRAPAATFEEHS